MNEVYLITNMVNGKRYVGITCRGYLNRWKEHQYDANYGRQTILGNAIRKYGAGNFQVELIESGISDAEIGEKEIYYIKLFETFYSTGKGYNMTVGGGGVAGYKHLESTKAKISSSLIGHVFPESRNKKIQKAMLGREYKLEWREALSKSRLGRFTKENNSFYGKHHSEETKSIISKANTRCEVLRFDPKTRELLEVHANQSAAGRWVVENKLSSAQPETCAGRIGEVCRIYNDFDHTAYGFVWIFKEGQSTNCRLGDELPVEAQTSTSNVEMI